MSLSTYLLGCASRNSLSLGVFLGGACADVVGRIGLLVFVDPPPLGGDLQYVLYLNTHFYKNVTTYSHEKTLLCAYVLAKRKFTEIEFPERDRRYGFIEVEIDY